MRDLTEDEVNALRRENGLPPVKRDTMPDWAKARTPTKVDPELQRWCAELLRKFRRPT